MLSLMVPLAMKAATAEMSVLMAYVRYWVCFLNLQLYKIMIFINLGSQTFSPFAFMVFAYGLFFFFIYCVCEARLFGMHQSHNLELNCFPPADVFIS